MSRRPSLRIRCPLLRPAAALAVFGALAALGACGSLPSGEGEEPRAVAAGQRELPLRLPRGAERRAVRRLMREMSLEQMIGQRFICWVEGTEYGEQAQRLVRQGAAGVILYPWNVQDPRQVRELVSCLQQAALAMQPPIGLFVAVDQEGGRVAALRLPELSALPPAFRWGSYDDPLYVSAAAYLVCRELRELGCNMNLAPVLDLYGSADASVIGDRSFGPDPQRVGRLGVAYLEGARRAGVIPVFKHFPGHGGSTVDSHGALPVVDLAEAELAGRDLLPFRTVVEAGAEALMTAHVLYPQLDRLFPATVSETVLRELLRDGLGYEGVIVSDGLSMGALAQRFSVSDSLFLMFRAGLDLVLVHSRYDLSDLEAEVLRLLRQGHLDEEQIREGAERVLRLKLRYGLLPPTSGG